LPVRSSGGRWLRACAGPACSVVLLLAAAGAAAAAPATTPEDEGLENVTVTATRLDFDAFDVPAAISTILADRLVHDALGVNVSDDIGMVPGLLARNRNNYAQDQQVSIRGFGASSAFGVRGIRIYQDGIPFSGPDGQGQVSQINLASAQRIEVLRGPFSALYGNSSGGVIQIFTTPGEGPARVHSAFAGGSYGNLRADAGVAGGAGPWGYNFDLTHFQVGGYRPHSSADSESFNGRVDYHINDASHLMAIANIISRPDAQDPLGLTPAEFAADPYSTDPAAFQYNTRKALQQQQGGVTYDLRLSDTQALAVMTYGGHRTVQQFLAIPASAQSASTSSGGVVDLDRTFGGADVHWSLDSQLAGRAFTWVVGMAYDYQDELRRGYNNYIGTSTAPQYGLLGALKRDENDIVSDFDQYVQGSWDIGSRWTVMAGVRHVSVRFDSQDHFFAPPRNLDDSGATHYGAMTPVAGLMYKASDAVHVYASYGQGFQTPIGAELAYRPDGAPGLNLGLRPARNTSVELGTKIDMSPHLHAELALFQAQTNNDIVVDTNVGGRATYQNAPSSRRRGLEISLDERWSPDWQFQLAYTFLEAIYTAEYLTCVSAPCATPTAPVISGNRLPGVPRSDLYLALRYGQDLGWHASATGQYISSVAVNDTNCTGLAPGGTPLCPPILQTLTPSYAVFGLEGGYGAQLHRTRLEGFLRVNNLVNRHYVGSVIVNDANQRFFEPGPGFSVLAGVSASFR
jgi:iron complex outermembrane receptor protein